MTGCTRFALIVTIGLVLTRVVPALDDVSTLSTRRDEVTAAAMGVLGSWSAANLAAGTALWLTSDDPERATFWQMNAGWNVVNAALAVPSYIGARRRLASPPSLSLSESILQQNRLEDTLLFNAGIDVGYMAFGLYLVERSRRGGPDAEQLAGFGRSLIVQGGFLLAFDAVVYAIQRRVGRELARLADG